MKIIKIEAAVSSIRFTLDESMNGTLLLRESVPVILKKPGRTLSLLKVPIAGCSFEIPRMAEGHDRIFSFFTLFLDNRALDGVRYITDIDPAVPENNDPYPQPPFIKTFGAPPEMNLDIRQSLININLPAIMTTLESPDTISYVHNGRTFYFLKSKIEKLDKHMLSVPMTTMILLNSPRMYGSTQEKALLDACIHPGFDWNYRDAYISAFDMETEEGQAYYGAFVEFLAERYSRPDHLYGHAVGAIISNEVNSQYIWGNAGEMPVEEYMKEYTQALRLAWICGQKHCSHFRVYISLDQFWCGVNFDPTRTGRYYSGRSMLDLLNQYCLCEGNFGWAVAHHPYPEDLRWPDFWHDRAPNFTFSTPKITFKNMEVLEAYLSQKQFSYHGAPRRIIFSEQGFNSMSGDLQQVTEEMAAAGYVLAYLKARNMKTVDLFTHHAFVDNPHEFGLNLGIFRYDPSKPNHIGEPKPIFESVKSMETDQEEDVIAKARAYIGPALFDYLLHPPVEYGERDSSKDNEFGTSN